MQNRTIKELLQVMLDNQGLFEDGLCNWARDLFEKNVISNYELYIILHYIRNNRPSKYSSFQAFLNRNSGSFGYYWFEGSLKPRVKWLKKHIKLNSK